jgi:hypothetical protein
MAGGNTGFTNGELRMQQFMLGLVGSVSAGLIIWFLQTQFSKPTTTTVVEYGIPKDDIQRAMTHYGITAEEYLSNPQMYPLPGRGSGIWN